MQINVHSNLVRIFDAVSVKCSSKYQYSINSTTPEQCRTYCNIRGHVGTDCTLRAPDQYGMEAAKVPSSSCEETRVGTRTTVSPAVLCQLRRFSLSLTCVGSIRDTSRTAAFHNSATMKA